MAVRANWNGAVCWIRDFLYSHFIEKIDKTWYNIVSIFYSE